jgi:YVTN family beta-propeller protein
VVRLNPKTNQVIATIPNMGGPMGLAFDGQNMWVSNPCSNTVSEIDRATNNVIATVPGFSNPQQLVYDGHYVWVVDNGHGTVAKIDPATASVVATVPVGADVRTIAYDGTYIWASAFNGNVVSKVDPTSNTVVSHFQPGGQPHGIFYDGANLWLANCSAGTVSEIDPTTFQAITSVSGLGCPTLMTLVGDDLWVTGSTGVSVISRGTSTPAVAGVRAYVHVLVDGTVDQAGSLNVTQANIVHQAPGLYCLNGLSFTPSFVNATLGWYTRNNPQAATMVIAQADQGAASPWGCPSGTQVDVQINSPNGQEDREFYLMLI